MPLPAVLEELQQQVTTLSTEVSILSEDLNSKDEDLLISNQVRCIIVTCAPCL